MALNDLLPPAKSSPRCAEFAAQLGVDPVGSAFRADLVLLVETPLPWPKPVNEHPLLKPVFPLMRGSALPTRILAYEPKNGGVEDVADQTRVVIFRRNRQGSFVRSDLLVPNANLRDEVFAVVSDPSFADEELANTKPSALLVCTQGSHDVCCGLQGATLAAEATATHRDVEVFRVSHTGGHRFSPTAVTMPDGRMWGFVSNADLEMLVDQQGPADRVAHRCRGWIGAPLGAGQAAERAVFGLVSWDLDSMERTVEVSAASPVAAGDAAPLAWQVEVTAAHRVWSVGVAIAREVPTVSCEMPGGLPSKPGREFVVTSIEERTKK